MLQTHGIKSLWDLIHFFPRTYEDRSQMRTIASLKADEPATFKANVLHAKRKGRGFEAVVSDGTGTLVLRWFRTHRGLEAWLQPQKTWVIHGTPKRFLSRLELAHPELIEPGKEADPVGSIHAGRLVPIYREISGLSTRLLRKILWNALEASRGRLPEPLPAHLLTQYGFPDLESSLRSVHFPPDSGPGHAWDRLVYEELFRFHCAVTLEKNKRAHERARVWARPEAEPALPFGLTEDQHRALEDIRTDLSSGHPMNRLLQGDVGSGKTIVAALCAQTVVAQGGQAVLLAPTEILAQQHAQSIQKLLGPSLPLALLTASTKAVDRRELLSELARGKPMLVVGTHALLEPDVIFGGLALVIGDEQHRFGVNQRQWLVRKLNGFIPHALWMSATPIPRTLALTVYGHLSLSVLRQKPAGRLPIRTHIAPPAWQPRAVMRIREQLREGRQVYWIFPAIEDAEPDEDNDHPPLEIKSIETDGKAVEAMLASGGAVRVERLHGRLSAEEKQAIMDRFARGETHVLIATTVVEVGMDVPNATVIVIENAERFGLSQLHQLRGRVGRGQHGSWCFLFCVDRLSEVAQDRLSILEKSEDGFEIAEADLRIRGPGEYLGKRQAGQWPFQIADPQRDQKWMDCALKDAQAECIRSDWRSS